MLCGRETSKFKVSTLHVAAVQFDSALFPKELAAIQPAVRALGSPILHLGGAGTAKSQPRSRIFPARSCNMKVPTYLTMYTTAEPSVRSEVKQFSKINKQCQEWCGHSYFSQIHASFNSKW